MSSRCPAQLSQSSLQACGRCGVKGRTHTLFGRPCTVGDGEGHFPAASARWQEATSVGGRTPPCPCFNFYPLLSELHFPPPLPSKEAENKSQVISSGPHPGGPAGSVQGGKKRSDLRGRENGGPLTAKPAIQHRRGVLLGRGRLRGLGVSTRTRKPWEKNQKRSWKGRSFTHMHAQSKPAEPTCLTGLLLP